MIDNLTKSRTFWIAAIGIVLNVLAEAGPLITPELFGETFAAQFHMYSAFAIGIAMIVMRQITVGPPGVDRELVRKALTRDPAVPFDDPLHR